MWTEDIFTPFRRFGHRVEILDDMLYVLGGISNEEGHVNLPVLRYNNKSGNWKKMAPMNHRRKYFSSAVMDGLIYVIGGNILVPGSIEVYDPAKNSWTLLDQRVSGTASEGRALRIKNRIYILGGNKRELAVFEPVGKLLVGFSKIPQHISHFSAVHLDGSIYVLGGCCDNLGMKKVWRFDISMGQWFEDVADMNEPRCGSEAIVIDGEIHIFGGVTRWSNMPRYGLASVERYDAENNKWEMVPEMCLNCNNSDFALVMM